MQHQRLVIAHQQHDHEVYPLVVEIQRAGTLATPEAVLHQRVQGFGKASVAVEILPFG